MRFAEKANTIKLVGLGYLLLFVVGMFIVFAYKSSLQDIHHNSLDLERTHAKSTILEALIGSARTRSFILVNAMFSQDIFDRDLLRFELDDEAQRISVLRSQYRQLIEQGLYSPDHQMIAQQELIEMDRHKQALNVAREAQERIFSQALSDESLLNMGTHFIKEALPLQNEAVSILQNLQQLNMKDRALVDQKLTAKLHSSQVFLWFSSVLYLFAWFLISGFSLYLLLKARQEQQQMQVMLEDKVKERTSAYEVLNRALEKEAAFDAVTGLLNRYSFQRYVEEIIQEKNQSFSLFFIDLDNFKWFNDTLGHDSGDRLLRDLSLLFSAAILDLPRSFLARIGGDEFVVICHNDNDVQDAALAQTLIGIVNQYNKQAQSNKSLGCSIGIAHFPRDAQTKSELLRYADVAMYHAKDCGKNRYVVFNDEMKAEIQQRLRLEEALDIAIKNDQLTVVYQAQFNLQTLSVVGAEALVRWYHQGQAISPMIFVPMAEKSGLIYDLGLSVFRASALQMAQWQASGQCIPRVAINLSPIQLHFQSLFTDLNEIVQHHGLRPEQIDFEITESTVMDEINTSLTVLHLLQIWGAEISLDDFGTGYSSLSKIKQLDVDRIKIDKSFVDDIETDAQSQSLVKAIINMAHSLGLIVLAEGIENEAQYRLLKDWGCDEGQGYWFARPVPASQFVFEPSIVLSVSEV